MGAWGSPSPCLPQKSSKGFLEPQDCGSQGPHSPPPLYPSLYCLLAILHPLIEVPFWPVAVCFPSYSPKLRVNVPFATPTTQPEPWEHGVLGSCEILPFLGISVPCAHTAVILWGLHRPVQL